ncbi:ERBB-3 BINDING PROTEIN 1 [Linum grandiflorum]
MADEENWEEEMEDEEELDLPSAEVVTKYKEAAKIVNEALELVVRECKPDVKIVELCEKGDSYIIGRAGNMYNHVENGVAFPTCVSLNNTVGNVSPLCFDDRVLNPHDIVKIEMGCHIDGFIAVVAHTHVVTDRAITGRAADVISAANTAAEVALRLVRPGKKNKDVTDAIQKVVAAYNCKIVEGVNSHQLKQFMIHGKKVIDGVANSDKRAKDIEFEENEVYAVDIVTSTGEGKPGLHDEEVATIYESNLWKQKFKTNPKKLDYIDSAIRSEISKIRSMPFTARAVAEKLGGLFPDWRLRHRSNLVMNYSRMAAFNEELEPYHVLHEKSGDYVARIKFTVLLMPEGSDRITSHTLQKLQPTKVIVDDPEIKEWLALGTKTTEKEIKEREEKSTIISNGKYSSWLESTCHISSRKKAGMGMASFMDLPHPLALLDQERYSSEIQFPAPLMESWKAFTEHSGSLGDKPLGECADDVGAPPDCAKAEDAAADAEDEAEPVDETF